MMCRSLTKKVDTVHPQFHLNFRFSKISLDSHKKITPSIFIWLRKVKPPGAAAPWKLHQWRNPYWHPWPGMKRSRWMSRRLEVYCPYMFLSKIQQKNMFTIDLYVYIYSINIVSIWLTILFHSQDIPGFFLGCRIHKTVRFQAPGHASHKHWFHLSLHILPFASFHTDFTFHLTWPACRAKPLQKRNAINWLPALPCVRLPAQTESATHLWSNTKIAASESAHEENHAAFVLADHQRQSSWHCLTGGRFPPKKLQKFAGQFPAFFFVFISSISSSYQPISRPTKLTPPKN